MNFLQEKYRQGSNRSKRQLRSDVAFLVIVVSDQKFMVGKNRVQPCLVTFNNNQIMAHFFILFVLMKCHIAGWNDYQIYLYKNWFPMPQKMKKLLAPK